MSERDRAILELLAAAGSRNGITLRDATERGLPVNEAASLALIADPGRLRDDEKIRLTTRARDVISGKERMRP
jgi:hypothetical protein